jgi:hypothetical protein
MLTERVPCPPPGTPGGCLAAGPASTSLGYGLGWFIDRTADGIRQEHEGRIDGYLSYNAIYPASGEHIVVLANSEATPCAGDRRHARRADARAAGVTAGRRPAHAPIALRIKILLGLQMHLSQDRLTLGSSLISSR